MYKRNILLLYVLFTLVIFLNAPDVFAGDVTLSWVAPPKNVDGTPFTDLAGYNLYYGAAPGNYSNVIPVGKVTTYTKNLPDNFYCFVVTAYDTSGNESKDSNEVCRSIQSTQQSLPNGNAQGSVIVYEDAEDGTINGWYIYDNNSAGANITNVYDYERMSRVIQLTGSGWYNGYWLKKDDWSAWNNTSQFVFEWSMKYSEYFYVYLDVDTTAGHRYVYYTPDDHNGLGVGEYVHHGLGRGVIDGEWHTFVRDLQADLKEVQPGVTILKVNGFLIRGSGKVDDIKLRDSL